MKTRSAFIAALLLLALTFQLSVAEEDRPQLVVIISIDQMRADHLTRFASLYSHGFTKLLREGVHFRTAELNYANSSTGPGHATLGTGVYPWKSGIVGNNYVDRGSGMRVYCVSDSTAGPVDGHGGGMSPKNLLATGFGDWVKAGTPSSKVISISYKDRAAILMGGKRPDAAFWYDRPTGRMTSSTYYVSTLPQWAKDFNASGWISKNLPHEWSRLRPATIYEAFGPDDQPGETPWNGKRTFPHVIPPGKEISRLFSTPWGNEYLLDFALSAVRAERLGMRGSVDVLWVSLSATDNIGSDFGPSSHEMIDNLLRIDAALGTFLDKVKTILGERRFVVALSGDHGVQELPERASSREKKEARRFDNSEAIDAAVREFDARLRKEFGITERILRSGTVNIAALKTAGVDPSTVEERLRQTLSKVDGVADVFFASQFHPDKAAPRRYQDKYLHSTFAGRSPDYFVRDCENCLIGEDTVGTGHGTPYAYDTQVPLVFWGTGAKPRVVDRIVHTVDLVATVAALYRIATPSDLDGIPLKEVVE